MHKQIHLAWPDSQWSTAYLTTPDKLRGDESIVVSLTSLLSFTPTNTRSMWSWQLSRDTWGHCTSARTSMCLQRRKNIALVNYTLPVAHIQIFTQWHTFKYSHSDTHSNTHSDTHTQHTLYKCMLTFIDTTISRLVRKSSGYSKGKVGLFHMPTTCNSQSIDKIRMWMPHHQSCGIMVWKNGLSKHPAKKVKHWVAISKLMAVELQSATPDIYV